MLLKLSSSRPDGLGHGLPSIVQTFPCRCTKFISSNHIRCDLRLGTLERDVGGPPLCESSMNGGDVAEAEVSQVPEETGRGIATAAEIAKERARAAAKSPSGKSERQGGNKGTEPGLLEPVGGRLDEFLRLRQFGTTAPALSDQIIEWKLVVDEPDDRLGRLKRRDDKMRIEHKLLDEAGRGHLQLSAGRLDRSSPAAQLGQGPTMVSLQASARASQGAGQVGQRLGITRGLTHDRQVAAGLQQIEVIQGHGQEGVIGRGPDAGPVRGHETTCCQGLVDRVRDPQGCTQSIEWRETGSRRCRRGTNSPAQRSRQ